MCGGASEPQKLIHVCQMVGRHFVHVELRCEACSDGKQGSRDNKVAKHRRAENAEKRKHTLDGISERPTAR